MNYAEQVAKMLEVKFDETFRLNSEFGDTVDGEFTLDTSLNVFEIKSDGKFELSGIVDIQDILSGEYEIVKLPWKPKNSGDYWHYIISDDDACTDRWTGRAVDLMRWKTGNCFRTEEEAKTKGKEIMERIEKEYEEA